MCSTPEHRLLVLCLRAWLNPDSLPAVRAHVSSTPLNWPAIVQLAQLERVAPLVYATLRSQGILAPAAEGALSTVYYQSAARNALLLGGLVALLPTLESRGVSVIVLKGAGLVQKTYGDIGLRHMLDVDLLVEPAQVAVALEAVLQLGYAVEPAEEWPGFARRYRSDVTCRAPVIDRHPAHIGLHWRLLDVPYYYRRIDTGEWFDRAMLAPDYEGRAFAPVAEDHLVYLCGHLALHHQYQGLLRYLDVAAMVRAEGTGLDWDGVLRRAVDWCLVLPLQRTVTRVEQWWPDIVPKTVTNEITALRPTFGEAWVHRSCADHRRNPSTELLVSFATLPGAGRRLQFLLEKAVPSPGYMQERYLLGRPCLWPLAYIVRPVRGLRHFFERPV